MLAKHGMVGIPIMQELEISGQLGRQGSGETEKKDLWPFSIFAPPRYLHSVGRSRNSGIAAPSTAGSLSKTDSRSRATPPIG